MKLESALKSQLQETASAARYIAYLAQQTGTHVDQWDLEKVFGLTENFKNEIGRSVINKKFFQEAEKIKKKTAVKKKPDVAIKKTITAAVAKRKKHDATELKRLLADRTEFLRLAGEHAMRYQASVSQAAGAARELRRLKKINVSVPDQIEKIVKGGFWELHEFVDDTLSFVTKNDIIISHGNRKALEGTGVNFGKFRVEVELRDAVVEVFPHGNNIYDEAGAYYHPHVDESGDVCWGNAAGSAATFLTDLDIVGLLLLLSTLLSNYNSSAPFVNLEDFVS